MQPEMNRLIEEARRNIIEVTPADAKSRIDAGAISVIVDVREPAEWSQGHIEGAAHVPFGQLAGVAGQPGHELIEHKQEPILLYCAHGVRSLIAADGLKKMGYSNVSSIAGGLVEWTRAGLPVSNSSG